MDQDSDWAKRCAVTIGQAVKVLRAQRNLSAQQLAERCAGLGMPSVTRTVITKLENGRKDAVSTAELVILAEALGVAPALLMFPVGYVPAVEVLPGREMTPWDACRWLLGGVRVPTAKGIEPPDGPIALWADHESLTHHIAMMRQSVAGLLAQLARSENPESLEQEIGLSGRVLDTDLGALRRLRKEMRRQGMTPPPLDPETAREIGEEVPDGAR